MLVMAAVLPVGAVAGCGRPASQARSETGGVTPSGPLSGSSAAAVTEVRVSVVKGRVATASRTVKVRRGATVRITVTSDVADEFHLHGYDRELELAPGRPGTLRLVASVPGVFEAELHHSGARLFELQVG